MSHLAADIRDLSDLLALKGYFTENFTATNRPLNGLSALPDVDRQHYLITCELSTEMYRER